MPTQQGVCSKNQDQLLNPGFLGVPQTEYGFQQGYQDELLTLADRRSALLMPTQDQQLLTQDEYFDALVIR
jgi:hypothetical protein